MNEKLQLALDALIHGEASAASRNGTTADVVRDAVRAVGALPDTDTSLIRGLADRWFHRSRAVRIGLLERIAAAARDSNDVAALARAFEVVSAAIAEDMREDAPSPPAAPRRGVH